MKKNEIEQIRNAKDAKIVQKRGGVTLKALSAAALAGLAFANPTMAQDAVTPTETPVVPEPKRLTAEDLTTTGNLIWHEVEAGTPDAIEVKLSDDVSQYFVYEHKQNTSSSIPTFDDLQLSTSGKVTWTEVSSYTPDAIAITLGDTTKYYTYKYTKPDDYTYARGDWDTYSTVFDNASQVYNGGVVAGCSVSCSIVADFLNNTSNNTTGYSGGGALRYDPERVWSEAPLNSIIGDFINNSSANGLGGAIYNAGTISYICGDFISNNAFFAGGAIYNYGEISTINGNFINNYAYGCQGGAIFNDGLKNGSINANFIGNHSDYDGGAIHNQYSSTIDEITGDFINNSAHYNGGAISNQYSSTIGEITGNFINNYVNSRGGAIYNYCSIIGAIEGNFVENSVGYLGGAIYNSRGTINSINGDFIYNVGCTGAGAIFNEYGSIDSISGNFIGNYGGYFGAIGNFGDSIDSITGTFIRNSANGKPSYGDIYEHIYGNGGAIGNISSGPRGAQGNIGTISGVFVENTATGKGGAIYNNANITDINGTFINNTAYRDGGAIANDGTIGTILGTFINNRASYGGAIYNTGTIEIVCGDFINNGEISGSWGSTIYNGEQAYFGSIAGNFINNDTAIQNYDSGRIGSIAGDFVGSKTAINNEAVWRDTRIETIQGNFINNETAIYNTGYIGSITGDFINNNYAIFNYTCQGETVIDYISGNFVNNHADSTYGQGAAIYNEIQKIGSITNSTFINNSARSSGGAIHNAYGSIDTITNSIFMDNSAGSNGGAIFNGSEGSGCGFLIGAITNSSFINNHAGEHGGAIYTTGDLTFNADNGVVEFSGNYVGDDDNKEYEAIYVANVGAKLDLNLKNNGVVILKDKINGLDGYEVNILGDSKDTTMMYLHNDINGANVNVGGTMLNTINQEAHNYHFNSLTLTGDTDMLVDVDLKNQQMDRLSADTYGEHNGNLNVVGMNLVSDTTKAQTSILFADNGLKDNVTNALVEVPEDNYQTTAYTPIYKYTVTYDNKEDGGYFVFDNHSAGASSGNASDNFNPAVLNGSVSSVAASQATINETFKHVFSHSDAFTQLPLPERMAKMNANKYALSTDFNHNLGSLCPEHNNNAAWFRPYVTFESMDLRNGPRVNAKTYGSLVGFDTDFRELKHGWHSVGTGYIGYTGNQLSYSGVSTTMNGGLAGYTETFYKNNFWTGLTLTAGASVGESHSRYGKEDFTSLMAGVGSKTGYNFEFKEGKYIIQPMVFMSYTFANTFDYTNAAGVKIKPGASHSLQLNPSLRFIANSKNGWTPYASVGMVWNVMNENKVMANDARLPEMGMKPYVEYGVGLQRNWKDKFTAYGQAMLRNGGRNGISLTAGFRWALGHEGTKPDEKVQRDGSKKVKTVLKQMPEKYAKAQTKMVKSER